MKSKKILMMDSRPGEPDGTMEDGLRDGSSQSNRGAWTKRSLKVKSQNFEMDRIDVTKIASDSTFWGSPGLRIVMEPALSLLSMSASWRRFSFSSSQLILGLLRHCYGAHCFACFSGPGLVWSNSLFLFFSFHSPCYFVYLPLNYPERVPFARTLQTPQFTTHTHGQRISFY